MARGDIVNKAGGLNDMLLGIDSYAKYGQRGEEEREKKREFLNDL